MSILFSAPTNSLLNVSADRQRIAISQFNQLTQTDRTNKPQG